MDSRGLGDIPEIAPPLPVVPPVGDPSDIQEPKPVHRFVPYALKNLFQRNPEPPQWELPAADAWQYDLSMDDDDDDHLNHHSTEGLPNQNLPPPTESWNGGSGFNSAGWQESAEPSVTLRTISQQEEEYRVRYGYMRSWSGLLRLLAVILLFCGAVIFACVCANIYKDNQWYNFYGYNTMSPGGYGYGGGTGSYGYGQYSYDGPKTPYVLVIAGLAWVVTVVMLVLGLTMYYRTILLDSNWWPPTEAAINAVLAVLYLSAAIVYTNDAYRGGLCRSPGFVNPISGTFCHIEGSQSAGMAFLYISALLYLLCAGVALKMWRHEVARRRKDALAMDDLRSSAEPKNRYVEDDNRYRKVDAFDESPLTRRKIEIFNGSIPQGHVPKPVVIPDYLAKFPAIASERERARYAAVFNDQFAEYKELTEELKEVKGRLKELDTLIRQLSSCTEGPTETERTKKIFTEYERKKNVSELPWKLLGAFFHKIILYRSLLFGHTTPPSSFPQIYFSLTS
uniref:MARVEL domain containing 2b n=1 Tax=Eptatretus burgeri TaxID=7764 RepID=A0A8C4Q3T3_EPTBU